MLDRWAFCSGQSGETFSTINPATGKKLCDVARGNSNDIDAAVKAARAALRMAVGLEKLPASAKKLS